YTYDSQDRIIKTSIKKKGVLSQERAFSYSTKADTLLVSLKYTYFNGRRGFTATSYYVNGFLVKEDVSSGTYRYIVETDAQGNKIDFYDADKPNAKHFETVNRYYSDVNKPIKIEYGYYKLSNSKTAKKTGTIYVNGKRSTDVAISKGVKPNEKVIYDGLTQTYYTVQNIVPENHTIDTKIPVTNVISKGNPYINYVHDGKFINYVHGFNKVKKRDFAFLGVHMIDYRIDKSSGRTYIVRNYKNMKEKRVKQMELFSTDTSSILYIRELKKENFFIVVKGKHIDYKKARFEYLTNGDPVIFLDNNPTYILNGFRMAEDNQVLTGSLYNGELDKAENKEGTKQAVSNKLDCIDGDCENGWGKLRVGDILTEATFKNGAIDGVAYITYPKDSYYHGQYVNNRRHGFGYYHWASGKTYIGYWKDGKQHGLGYLMDKDNKVISGGTYENGELVKSAMSENMSQNINGNCAGNCTDGFGKYTYNNGDVYWGFFKNGQRAGVGTYKWKNKSSYVGSYTDDGVRNGYGMYTYVDRSVYKGIFVNDRIDGLGMMKYNKTGNVVRGVFNNKGAKVKDYE
ncbi:MAG: MORN motif precursor, partial [Bacteroidota bacterium]